MLDHMEVRRNARCICGCAPAEVKEMTYTDGVVVFIVKFWCGQRIEVPRHSSPVVY